MASLAHLRNHPRLFIAAAIGVAVALLPGLGIAQTRALAGWNAGVWLYLASTGWAMLHADEGRLRTVAQAQAEGAGTILAIVVVAALASLLAIVFELSALKAAGRAQALGHVSLVLATVLGSWLLVPTLFTLNYATHYYRSPHGGGLLFPGADEHFQPGYGDLLYFSFTIAVACQTADVAVLTPALRRLVLLQSLLSFVFNTTILALTINIAASLF